MSNMSLCYMSRSFTISNPSTSETYTLSLHDALPISGLGGGDALQQAQRELAPDDRGELDDLLGRPFRPVDPAEDDLLDGRSEEHTSELQSQSNLVCRLLFEKKKSFCITLWILCEQC